jgi:hypothetical protein
MKFVADDGKVFNDQKECALYEKELANCYWQIAVKKDKAHEMSDEFFINVFAPHISSDETIVQLYLEDWCNRHLGSVLIEIDGQPVRKYRAYNCTKQVFNKEGKDYTHYEACLSFDESTNTDRLELTSLD